MGISNLEARIKKLENTSQSEFGTPANTIFFPVRKLMLSEEKSHNEDGVAFPVLVATWDKPAGVLLPDSIRLIHNDTTVSLAGTATSYRMAGYAVGNAVTVNVTAIYAQGASSTVVAVKTITGDTTPPSVPTNLTVAGGFRTLTLRWENPTAEDFSHVEIWESITDNNIATAERIAQAYGTEFVRSNCGVLETRWYWIRALDTHGNYSDFTSAASGTTTAIAMEDVPENTISESMLVDALAQKIDDSDAAIQLVEDVRMGEVNVFRQASAPTEGMITGDLWIDNTEVVYRYEGGEWASKEGTPVYDLLKTAIAQYVVKTQTATGDGRLKVAGFGLYNDSTTGSEFAILADKFYVYAQKEDGSSYTNVQVFTVDSTTTPPTVGINGNLIVDGSIVGEKIYAGAKIQLGVGGELIIGTGGLMQIGNTVYMDDTRATFAVSRFQIGSAIGSAGTLPFYLAEDSKVYINTAVIKDASIERAKIGALSLGTADIADAAITTAKIGSLQVTGAKIASATIERLKMADGVAKGLSWGNSSFNSTSQSKNGSGSFTPTGASISIATESKGRVMVNLFLSIQAWNSTVTIYLRKNGSTVQTLASYTGGSYDPYRTVFGFYLDNSPIDSISTYSLFVTYSGEAITIASCGGSVLAVYR